MNSHFVYQQDVASNLGAEQCYIATEITQPSGEQGYQASHGSDVIKPHPMECLALTRQERKYHTDSYVNTTSNFSDDYTISHTLTNPFSNSSSSSNESQNLNVLAQPAFPVPVSPPSPPGLHEDVNASQPSQVIQSLQSSNVHPCLAKNPPCRKK
jgi:hypothetical protein